MLFARHYPAGSATADIIREHRARIAVEAAERMEKRRTEQAEQRESSSTPEMRIRVWEKVHGLRLPLDTAHPIVAVVATETHLTLAEVQEEQRARRTARHGDGERFSKTAAGSPQKDPLAPAGSRYSRGDQYAKPSVSAMCTPHSARCPTAITVARALNTAALSFLPV